MKPKNGHKHEEPCGVGGFSRGDYATNWMWTYNHERPNMALGGITPKQKLAMAQ
jgi:hypothetical protein